MPESRDSLFPFRELLDRGLALEGGKRLVITCETEGKAINLLYRLNALRALDRKDAMAVYGPDAKTPFDELRFSRDCNVIKIYKAATGPAGILEIHEEDPK